MNSLSNLVVGKLRIKRPWAVWIKATFRKELLQKDTNLQAKQGLYEQVLDRNTGHTPYPTLQPYSIWSTTLNMRFKH